MSGLVYLAGAIGLNVLFVRKTLALSASRSPQVAMGTFRYSIHYLLMLFSFLLADHYCRI